MNLKIFKKHKKKILAGLLFGVLFLFAFVPPAKAGLFDIIVDPGTLVFNIMAQVAYYIFQFFSILVWLGASILELASGVEKFTTVPVVQVGWQITRDLCNMGFALILLAMAFDSVLGMGKFPVKSVLPKLIIVALLINFSLVFAGIIIDFSQIVTKWFLDAAGGPNHSIANQLANGLNIAKIWQTPDNFGAEMKLGIWKTGYLFIFSIFFGIIILMIAAFSLFAAAIFFIARMVQLWILLISAPFAWLSLAGSGIPKLGGYWNEWWGDFLKWVFFAPTYAFFIYLAVYASVNLTTALGLSAGTKTPQSVLTIQFFQNGFRDFLQYLVVVGLMLAGLKYAQKSGIAGSKLVMGWGNKLVGKAKSWAKRPGQFVYDKAAPGTTKGIGKMLSNIPGFRRTGAKIQSRATQMKQGAAGREQHKAYENLLGNMSEADLRREVNSAWGVRKMIAARKLKDRNLATKEFGDDEKGEAEHQANDKSIKKAMATFKQFGMNKEAGELEELRPDLIENEGDRKKAVEKATKNGNYKKWNKYVYRGEEGAAIAGVMMERVASNEIPQSDLNETIKGLPNRIKEAMSTAFQGAINKAMETDKSKGEQFQRSFAEATNKIEDAFQHKDPQTGEIVKNTDAMKEYIKKLDNNQIKAIREGKERKDSQLVGEHMTIDQAKALRGLSGDQMRAIREGGARNADEAVRHRFAMNPAAQAANPRQRGGQQQQQTRPRGPWEV